MAIDTAAIIFCACTAIVIVFQLCLALGAPWGKASMGGKYPGKYPPKMRIVALVNILVLGFLGAIVLAESELMFSALEAISGVGIWVVVAFSGLGTVMNSITPSKIERIWAPVAFIQMVTSLIVAIG